MVPEAGRKQTEHGVLPEGEGWYVLNAREAEWDGERGPGGIGRLRGRRALRAVRGQHPGARSRRAELDVPRRGGPGGLPRPLRRVHPDHRGRGATARGLGLRALSPLHPPCLRRRRRRAVRDPHDRRAPGERPRLPGGRDGAEARRRGYGRDARTQGCVRTVSAGHRTRRTATAICRTTRRAGRSEARALPPGARAGRATRAGGPARA